MTTRTTPPPISAALTGAEIAAVRKKFGLSVNQFAEVLGFAPSAGARRVRRWEEGAEPITGSALAALKYLRALDRALGFIDDGQWERAATVLRDAMPEFMS